MKSLSRRILLLNFGGGALSASVIDAFSAPITPSARAAKAQSRKKVLSKQEWMAAWMDAARAIDDDLWLGRFLDPWYFLLKPIAWRPSPEQAGTFEAVEVPAGFVTDLASIPWPLWSTGLRPDGQYAYAAIVHDYLYWTQTRGRAVADQILKFGMQDLRVNNITINAIYSGVRLGGQSGWDEDARLKASGEKRILVRYPKATDTWAKWKMKSDVFAIDDVK
jgi:Protein of unknown function (DUF1353)